MRENVEICEHCKVYYAGCSYSFLAFGIMIHETSSINNPYVKCVTCKRKIKRHDSFMESLENVKDYVFLTKVVQRYSDKLKEKSLYILIELIKNITVPSFCVPIDKENNINHELNDLYNLNLIRIINTSINTIIIVNAKELELHNRLDILETVMTQQLFNFTPETNKRYERIKNMINDFTDVQKEELLLNFNNKCAFTGKEVSIHIDHVIPISWQVEGTTLSNMLPLWDKINMSKHDSNVFEWYEINGEKYEVNEKLFIKAITYIANLNGMTFEEYKNYVYQCEERIINK